MGGIQKIALFGKRPNPRTAQISKEKRQSAITLRHEGQSILTVYSSAVTKTIKCYDETATGKEDPELPLLQRMHSLEVTATQIAA